jgi:hypothetical protein
MVVNMDLNMTYPKIHTLFKRDLSKSAKKKGVIIPGKFSKREFENIKWWEVTEKIDGTNIRVSYNGEDIKIGGRTSNAQIHPTLYTYLSKKFTTEKMVSVFGDNKVILFGEGVGPKIQKGSGDYSSSPEFILFDVVVEDNKKTHTWWLERENVKSVALKLGIRSVVTHYNHLTTNEIITLIQSSPRSEMAKMNSNRVIEGFVARPYPLMFFRDGTPILMKLKVDDFWRLQNG